MKNSDPIIEKAYLLLNEPIDPNHKVPVEIAEIVDYKEAAAGEDAYAYASPDTDRPQTVISIYTNGELVYNKITLEEPVLLSFGGLQSKLETVLLDEILNSKDQSALAHKKGAIIRQMDCSEARMILDLCQASPSQEISKTSGEDLLDVIIRMKQLISSYSTDYILLVANDVMDAIEVYDKQNVTSFNYKMSILDQIAALGISKIVKVLGKDNVTPVLADGKAVLVGRNSSLITSKPLILTRRKFSKEIAEGSGATEGAVRLLDIIRLPVHNDSGVPILGYSVLGYESLNASCVNFRAIAYSTDIIS